MLFRSNERFTGGTALTKLERLGVVAIGHKIGLRRREGLGSVPLSVLRVIRPKLL